MRRLKRFIAVFCCLALFTCFCVPAQATEVIPDSATVTEIDLGDGFTATDVLTIDTTTRATTRSATLLRTYEFEDSVIARIEIEGTFQYNGSTVSVVSKSINRSDTYNGWKFTKTSFTSSGGKITLEGKLTKLIIYKAYVDMSLTCDKNGNIS